MPKSTLRLKIIVLISVLALLSITAASVIYFQSQQQNTSPTSSQPVAEKNTDQPKKDVKPTENANNSIFPLLYLQTDTSGEKLFDQSGKEYINPNFKGSTSLSNDSTQIIADLPNKVTIWNFKNDTYKSVDKTTLIPAENKILPEFRVIDNLKIDQNKIYYRILESVEMYDKESADYNLCGDKKCGVFEFDLDTKNIRKIEDEISHSQYDGRYSNSIFEVGDSKITLFESKSGGSLFQSEHKVIDLQKIKSLYVASYAMLDAPASPNPNIKIQVKDGDRSFLDFNCDYIVDAIPNKDCITSLKTNIEDNNLLSYKIKQEFLSDIGRRVEEDVFVENCGKYKINNISTVTLEDKIFKLDGMTFFDIKCIK